MILNSRSEVLPRVALDRVSAIALVTSTTDGTVDAPEFFRPKTRIRPDRGRTRAPPKACDSEFRNSY